MSDIKKFVKYFKKSKAFCVMPWIHYFVRANGKISPCCVNTTYEYGTNEDLDSQSVIEFANNEKFKNIRKQMMSGELPTSCWMCKENEKSFGKSWRTDWNRNAETLLSEQQIQQILDTPETGEFPEFKLRYADVRSSNICNLKCRYCSPYASSRIQAEEKVIGIFKNGLKLSKYNLSEDLMQIYFAGGEPLIDEEHYNILDKLEANNKFKINLIYNSNFTNLRFKNKHVLDYWKKFEFLTVQVSMDDLGPRQEYIRNGSNTETILSNFAEFHSQIHNSYDRLKISITISVLNFFYIDEVINGIIDHNLVNTEKIDFNYVRSPEFLSTFRFLPILRQNFRDAVNRIKDTTIRLNLKKIVEDEVEEFSREENLLFIENFYQKIREKDKIRNEKFEEVFPELHEAIQSFGRNQ